jgi:hypothetical protein
MKEQFYGIMDKNIYEYLSKYFTSEFPVNYNAVKYKELLLENISSILDYIYKQKLKERIENHKRLSYPYPISSYLKEMNIEEYIVKYEVIDTYNFLIIEKIEYKNIALEKYLLLL